ncbi:MAG: hypothetical protein KDI98_09810 [Hyphomicrobiaceae bacterium]|nr:hypothetical protein [Hyphomicrobiaceae bacterium]
MDIRPSSANLPVPASRAVVPVAPKAETDERRAGEDRFYAGREAVRLGPRYRAGAPFLAQLIASELKMPQTRLRRRAGPDAAHRAYQGAMEGPGMMSMGFSATV